MHVLFLIIILPYLEHQDFRYPPWVVAPGRLDGHSLHVKLPDVHPMLELLEEQLSVQLLCSAYK